MRDRISMTCTESNIVEQTILDAVTKLGGKQVPRVRKDAPPYRGESLGDELRPALWTYVSYDQVTR